MRPVAKHLQRIVSPLDQMRKILVRALPDHVRPLLYIAAPQFAHPRVVEQALRIAQRQRQRFDRRAQELVNARFQFLLLHWRLVHVDQWMPTVVVEDDARLGHMRLLECLESTDWPRVYQ